MMESFWGSNPEFMGDVFEAFKRLYMDWLRFFRANMECPCGLCLNKDCPSFCPLDYECPELERVWHLWLDTLTADDRSILD
jgi:hypothetical protein